MSPKSLTVLAVVAAAIMVLPLAAPAADADASGAYYDQLDEDGKGLYDLLGSTFDSLEESPQATAEIRYAVSHVMFLSEDEAASYAESLVDDTLSAYYLQDPQPIWLWDYPVTSVAVDVVTTPVSVSGATWYTVSVSFQLSAPAEYADSLAETIAAVEEALGSSTYTGTVQDIVSSINGRLRSVTVEADGDGTVSSVYDALVTGTSSSAGIAAAFTLLCSRSGVTAATAAGSVLTATDGTVADGYWNLVLEDGAWYAVDCTWNTDEARNVLMAGTSTSVVLDSTSYGYGATHSANLGAVLGTSLSVPAVSSSGVEWPDDSSFLERYGAYIMMALIAAVIVAAMVYAIRTGNV